MTAKTKTDRTSWSQEEHATQINLYGAHIYLREAVNAIIKAKGLVAYDPGEVGIVEKLEELIFECENAQNDVIAQIVKKNNAHKEE